MVPDAVWDALRSARAPAGAAGSTTDEAAAFKAAVPAPDADDGARSLSRAEGTGPAGPQTPSRQGVLVNLSTAALAAGHHPPALLRMLPPLGDVPFDRPGEQRPDSAPAGDGDRSRNPAAQTETRGESPSSAPAVRADEAADDAGARTAPGNSVQQQGPAAAPARPGPATPAAATVEPPAKTDTPPAPILAAAAATLARTELPDTVKGDGFTSPLRPLAELVAPLLLRQEHRAEATPYLNRLLLGSAAFGAIVLILLW